MPTTATVSELDRVAHALADAITQLAPSDIVSVYGGRAGRCCCGCSGNHRYNPAHLRLAGRDRGYQVGDEEVSAVSVARILNKVKRNVALAEIGDNNVAVELNGRLYVVYPLPSVMQKSVDTRRKN